MKQIRTGRDTNIERLGRLEALSWLSASELRALSGLFTLTHFKRGEVILREAALASDAHILLSGVARITCLNSRNERVTVAFLAPGPIPAFPAPPISRSDFQCEACNNCAVGSLKWSDFESVTANGRELALRKLHENDLKHWYQLLLRSSGLLSLDLHDRVAITLLELCSDFGIEDSRGTLLRVSFSHKDIASLVGASRPRVTEHLGQLERDRFVLRQGRQLVVRADKLSDSLVMRASSSGRTAQTQSSVDEPRLRGRPATTRTRQFGRNLQAGFSTTYSGATSSAPRRTLPQSRALTRPGEK